MSVWVRVALTHTPSIWFHWLDSRFTVTFDSYFASADVINRGAQISQEFTRWDSECFKDVFSSPGSPASSHWPRTCAALDRHLQIACKCDYECMCIVRLCQCCDSWVTHPGWTLPFVQWQDLSWLNFFSFIFFTHYENFKSNIWWTVIQPEMSVEKWGRWPWGSDSSFIIVTLMKIYQVEHMGGLDLYQSAACCCWKWLLVNQNSESVDRTAKQWTETQHKASDFGDKSTWIHHHEKPQSRIQTAISQLLEKNEALLLHFCLISLSKQLINIQYHRDK